MIGTSTPSLLFIRACVIFLNNVTIGSILYCALIPLVVRFWDEYRLPLLLECWAGAETAFYVFFFVPYKKYLQRDAVHPAPMSRAEREALFQRCTKSVSDPETYLSRWFFGAQPQDIRLDNVREFISWAFFDTTKVSPQDEDELESYVKGTESMLGRRLPAGRGSAKSLRLTLGKVDFLHRSLLWYSVRCLPHHPLPWPSLTGM